MIRKKSHVFLCLEVKEEKNILPFGTWAKKVNNYLTKIKIIIMSGKFFSCPLCGNHEEGYRIYRCPSCGKIMCEKCAPYHCPACDTPLTWRDEKGTIGK